MQSIFFFVALFMLAVSELAQTPQPRSDSQTKTANTQPPNGWITTGANPQDYEIYLDSTVYRSGKASGTLKSKPSSTNEMFAAMAQAIKPDNYRGKRIRLSGYLKTADVAYYSGFWLRIDGAEPYKMLGFDNMGNRPVKGTSDWKKYEVVLDVPNDAGLIVFGVNLAGIGQVWADDMKIEVVGNDVASTNRPPSPEDEAAMQKQDEEMRR